MTSNNFLIFLIIFLYICRSYAGLYDDNVDVISLNNLDYDANVVGSENAWIIEFYSSWCGHCVRFAPRWKSLAAECKGWKKLVKVAALDCAQKENAGICMYYAIHQYPTVSYLPASSATRPDRIEVEVGSSTDVVKRLMIDFIVNDSISNIPQSKLLPLVPLRQSSDIWQRTDIGRQPVVVVFYEPETSYLGREVILDLYDERDSVAVGWVVQNVTEVTSYLLHRDGSQQLLKRSANKVDHMGSISKLRAERLKGGDKVDNLPKPTEVADGRYSLKNESAVSSANDSDPSINWNSTSYTRLHVADLESTLLYTLRHEIPLRAEIDVATLRLLLDHLQVLVEFLPVRSYTISRLEKIIKMATEQSKKENNFGSLSGQAWLEMVDQVFERKYYPNEELWVSCNGSRPGLRGYPCGLWMTFHSVTINALEKRNDGDCIKALLSIRNYVQHIFGCKECSSNFMKGASRIEQRVASCRQAAVFLWRSHNKANAKLKGDASEDPKHPKTIFPNELQCPACRRAEVVSYDGQRNGWDEKKVLAFLSGMYGRSRVVGLSPPRPTLAGPWWAPDAYGGSRYATTGLFNGYDVGVCTAFYCLCAVLVVALYLHFLRRRRRRRMMMMKSKLPF